MTALRAQRLLLGLSMRQVYFQTFIYPSRLSLIERGKVKSLAREKRALAQLYAVPVDVLFPKEGTDG